MKIRIFLIVLVLLAGATAGGAWWWARQSLPPYDGEHRLAGLMAPVEILFDDFGVPHAYAAGPEDIWMTAGVLHARDRLWQMELYRRAAYGRLSEVLGERTLPIDKRLVTLGMRGAAEAEWNAAPPAVRAALSRYADGVNAQMAMLIGRLKPLEFQILRYDPAPWTPIDSLAIARLMAWRLAENHQSELVRHALASRFGAVETQRLAGSYPANAPTVLGGPPTRTPAGNASSPSPSAARGPAASAASGPSVTGASGPSASEASRPSANAVSGPQWPAGLEWLEPSARRGNSNNFVVSGKQTASGRPLVVNDPHLEVEFPSAWYEMHLIAAGLDVIGVSVPGAPFVVIGHNARVAWGLTNTNADVQDLYVERLDLARRRYFDRGQWVPIDIAATQIPVRGRAAVPFEIWRTRRGVIFAEVGLQWEEPPAWLQPGGEREGERQAFALRWDATGEMAGAFEALDRANGWDEFLAAIERFSGPSQNFVYADVDGNIGYAMSGVLPLRAGGNGTIPSDGASGEGEWTGRVSPAKLPRAFNPPAGYITSSNNEIDRSWSGLITRDWAAPFRAIRLHEALSRPQPIGVSNATQLQNDVVSVAAERVLAGIEPAINSGKGTGVNAISLRVLQQLRGWDRKVDARPVVATYEAFEDALWRRTFFDEMGDPLFNRFYEWAGAERPSGLYAILDDPSSKWFDDIGTIDHRETRDDIYVLAARDASERLQRDFGEPETLDWTELHAAEFTHALSAGGFPLRWLFNRGPAPLPGDGTTLMRVSYHRMRPFRAWEYPSWRQVLDVGNWDQSRVILPTGQSGHPLSVHYFDQHDLWRQGQYRPQPFTRTAVGLVSARRLYFVP